MGPFPRKSAVLVLAAALLVAAASHLRAQEEGEKRITLLATETLEATGLLGHVLPVFEDASGISVDVIARGASEAIRLAQAGRGDAMLLDDYASEQDLVDSGIISERRDVLYAEMFVVGPQSDPAGVAGMVSVIDAFRLISRSQSAFISRGDRSGTHQAEISFWDEAGTIPSASSNAWYTVTEADMRTTLGLAAARNAYTLTDRSTWLRLRNRRRLRVLVMDDPRLLLRFGVSVLNPEQVEGVKQQEARAFMVWLTGEQGQERIQSFEINGERPYSVHLGLQNE